MQPYPDSDHLQYLHCDAVWRAGVTGRHVRVAVLDTGVHAGHPYLQSTAARAASGASGPGDENGHGTCTVGLIAGRRGDVGLGVAPEADVMSIRVTDRAGKTVHRGLHDGLQAAREWGAHVVCISLTHDTLDAAEIQAFADFQAAAPAVILAASGNRDDVSRLFPACLSGVVGVTATRLGGALMYRLPEPHPWIRVATFGQSLLSAGLDGGFKWHEGTSAATAVAAGVLALCLSVAADEAGRRRLLASAAELLVDSSHQAPGRIADVRPLVARARTLLG